MTTSLDFTLLPIVRRQGVDQPELPGLMASLPPRRAGRGRAQDRLMMHLALQGNAPLSSKAQGKLLDSLAQTYFKSTGSSTAAMRVVAESLNQSLFSRNQRGSSRGMRSLGIFTLAVFRNARLYLAQCGAAHAFLVRSNGLQHFHDPATVGRGLGMGRATPIQYHQAEIAAGDFLIVSPVLPPSWNQTVLRSLYGKPIEEGHLQLLEQSGPDVEAILIQIASGTGKMNTLRPEPVKSTRQEQPVSLDDLPAPPVDLRPKEEASPQIPTPKPEISEGQLSPEAKIPSPTDPGQHSPITGQTSVVVAPRIESAPELEEIAKPLKPKRDPIVGPALLTMGRAVGTTLRQFFLSLGALIRRMLPDEKMLDLPPSVMLFGAIAVPLVIVTVASMVYLREGRGRLHQEKLAQAQSVAEQALPLEDPVEVRAAWGQVVDYLDEAETYGSSDDSQNLRLFAYSMLDDLDIVERLDYQPAIVRGLPNDVTVDKIVVNADNELYLLTAEDGYVLRATYSDQGYVLDTVFNCGPVPQPLMVGPLIDIAALPRGQEDGATLLGMDANGNLLRCIPGQDNAPLALQMAPPDINWGDPKAFALDGGNIYVLDPQTNAVWIYWGIDGYTELPTYYFGNQVPPLQSVVSMTVNDGDMYLLHDDGHMTMCTYSSYIDAPTRCTEPAEFIDLRAGYQNGPYMQDTNFSQMQFAPPPDPSIYLFDPLDEAIYHFSMRLAFQRQYRPLQPLLADQVTAFAVGQNRRAFIATNDQVYFAIMP